MDFFNDFPKLFEPAFDFGQLFFQSLVADELCTVFFEPEVSGILAHVEDVVELAVLSLAILSESVEYESVCIGEDCFLGVEGGRELSEDVQKSGVFLSGAECQRKLERHCNDGLVGTYILGRETPSDLSISSEVRSEMDSINLDPFLLVPLEVVSEELPVVALNGCLFVIEHGYII